MKREYSSEVVVDFNAAEVDDIIAQFLAKCGLIGFERVVVDLACDDYDDFWDSAVPVLELDRSGSVTAWDSSAVLELSLIHI